MLNIIPLHNLIMNLRGRDTSPIPYLGLENHRFGIEKNKEKVKNKENMKNIKNNERRREKSLKKKYKLLLERKKKKSKK